MVGHLILSGLAGFLVGKLMRGEGYGFIIDVLLGLIGGWFGSMIFEKLEITINGNVGLFIASIAGASILVLLVRLTKKEI